ncbi:MAG TPA: HAD hydrolase family protein [bacterium]|nr:HAD hydrolase family protein [bacterium]
MRATLPVTSPATDSVAASEREFYAFYDWCLNPILSVRELFRRLTEELNRHGDLRVDWQRHESTINLYLFICAIACTVDDYLAWRPWNLSALAARLPRFRRGMALVQTWLNVPWSVRHRVRDASIVRWRRRWDHCVDRVCEMLVRHELRTGDNSDESRQWGELRLIVEDLTKDRLPHRLLQQRLRLPEGFRCQDLTHHDVFALAQRFVDHQPTPGDRLVILGPRTAGAYFAPLTKAYLVARGWTRVSWMTIRPKMGISWWEWRELRGAARQEARFLLVDDHPNTGATFRLMRAVLRQLRVPSQRITILAPHHPAEGDRPLLKDTEVPVIGLEPEDLYKTRWLGAGMAASHIREYYADWTTVRIRQSRAVDAVNAQLEAQYPDGFHVRLKRLFEVELSGKPEESVVRHLFVKSVGWGWLGYHAYLTGVRLADCVPPVVGLREGLLFTEWVGDVSLSHAGLPRDRRVRTLGSYVVKRAGRLRLDDDPVFGSSGYRWNGWDEIVTILRGAYGSYLGRLKVPALRWHLLRYVCPVPMLVDGRMRPDEWIATPAGIRKVDFEHHNFGGAEQDFVDPAWDLASAAFEFALSEQEERELLQVYAGQSGDRTISHRIFLYQLAYGVHTMHIAEQAVAQKGRGHPLEYWNARYLRARNSLIYRMNRYLAEPARSASPTAWATRLFFLDVDGVFDCERFGFPHTTPSGLAALELLRAHDFSVVLNTGRSVEHVRDYCQAYGLPGGIAEYGSVFVDAVAKSEWSLIDPTAAEQVARCRDALTKMPGISLDEGYRYSIRAYRWRDSHQVALDTGEVQDVLTQCGCDRLTFIPRLTDSTYLVQTGTSKGSALKAVTSRLGRTPAATVAMGDSEQDLDALAMTAFSYAPANCSKAIRELARRGQCRVMSQAFQRGLLAAVRDLLARNTAASVGVRPSAPRRESADIIRVLAHVAERPLLRQLVAVLDRRGL